MYWKNEVYTTFSNTHIHAGQSKRQKLDDGYGRVAVNYSNVLSTGVVPSNPSSAQNFRGASSIRRTFVPTDVIEGVSQVPPPPPEIS